jgi:hypothetical protein
MDDRFDQIWVAWTSFGIHGASSTESASVYSKDCGQQNTSQAADHLMKFGFCGIVLKTSWLLTKFIFKLHIAM